MVTIKGAMRTYGAAVRSMEREQQRRAREAAKRFKEQQKLQEIEDARQAVDDYNTYIDMLQSSQKVTVEIIDWKEIHELPEPVKPIESNENKLIAEQRLVKFKPNIFHKFFGLTKKKLWNLENDIKIAIEKDRERNDQIINKFEIDVENWKELQDICNGVMEYNPIGYKKALEYFDPFTDIGELGSKLNFTFSEKMVDVDLHVNSSEIIPDYELKQTSTGKLSKKNMTKSKFNELYQDHICSAFIRISREVLGCLPVEYVRVNAMSELLNSQTGHLEDKPILSVIIPPETLRKLNLDAIDPSDSMQNFVHNMKFAKTAGFKEVVKVELSN